MNLAVITSMLMDKDFSPGVTGWEFLVSPRPNTNVFEKCFCPEHAEDMKLEPGYGKNSSRAPNRAERVARARRRARR
jgi:hypothetical protein